MAPGRIIAGLLVILALSQARPAIPAPDGDAAAFVDAMVARHGFDRAELERVLAEASYKQVIIDAMTGPAEAMPWHRYRKIFLTEERIAGGVEYWKDNAATLLRAEQLYGVPPHVIVAIIGVETAYGTNMGKYRVIDALKTLGFGYPKRAEFFRSELEQFLLMAREEELDPMKPLGSYAGAMGKAQFIPSSFRRHAVDFDGDRRRDLWSSDPDAIGSIANYLVEHGWQPGAPVAAPTEVGEPPPPLAARAGSKPETTLAELGRRQVAVPHTEDTDRMAAIVRLEQETGPEYWLGYDNFYAITRYNHSNLYAMAVHQLSEAILERFALKERNKR